MLAERPLDLVVFMMGTNTWNADRNPEGLRELVELHRALRPGQPVLVLAPPDRGRTPKRWGSDPRVARVAEQLAGLARDNGAAFWSVRDAMGGNAAMSAFYYRGLAASDMSHLNRRGATILGERLAYALTSAYEGYVAATALAGCDR